MLTIKQITDNTEEVIRGLEKKHFKDAKATIEQVLAFNDKRRSTQNQLDKNLAEVNSLSKSIGQLMKEGKKEDAETAKTRVAEIKETSKALQAEMDKAQEDMTNLLYTIPNVPYDSVPEGVSAEDNVVEKMGGMETELPKNALPHWELAKKYDLIDFDLGVKITGAGFPNIILQYSSCPAYDGNGYLNIDAISGGEGKFITRGKAIDIRWEKDSPWGITHYYDGNEQEIRLNQGTTWVEIVQNDRIDSVTYQ